MIIYFLKFIASFLLPPGFLILALTGLNIWMYRQKQRSAYVLTVVIAIFYFVSTGYVGETLLKSLEGHYTPPKTPAGDVIVMLGGGATLDTPDIDGLGNLGGNAANRLITSARLQKQLSIPIILSGGQVYDNSGQEALIGRRILLGLGIPENMIIVESASLNTRQNAEYVKKIMVEKGFSKPILVTSAFHMERSVLNFAQCGVSVQPFPTDYMTSKKVGVYANNFVPSAEGLKNISMVLRERLGIMALKW